MHGYIRCSTPTGISGAEASRAAFFTSCADFQYVSSRQAWALHHFPPDSARDRESGERTPASVIIGHIDIPEPQVLGHVRICDLRSFSWRP